MSSTGVGAARLRDFASDHASVRTSRTRQTNDDGPQEAETSTLLTTNVSETNVGGRGSVSYRVRGGEVNPDEAQSQMSLPLDQRAKSVEGVVLTVDQASVSVRCRLRDKFVELSLPRAVVPDEVAHYGAAVTIEVDKTSVYRKLRISERRIASPIRDEKLDAIDAWRNKVREKPPGK